MVTPTIRPIVARVNDDAATHTIGKLQELRKELKHLSRRPTAYIFSPQTTFDSWACHHGGRTELQFNLGLEEANGVQELRHGVAFSFQRSQALPTIDVLIPKVRLFDDFVRLHSDELADMRMWHYRGDNRSSDYMSGPVVPELPDEGAFVFLGKRQPLGRIDYALILRDFDRLLPLYMYVESGGEVSVDSAATPSATFVFRAGCTTRVTSTIASVAGRQLDVNLRHNALETALYDQLAAQHGAANVGTEIPNGLGTSVDMVVRQPGEYWFYEIKTALSPRACLREALGQLLEYAFGPGMQEASRLIVVGEKPLDERGRAYLRRLRERFALPLEYEHIQIESS
jgi:hypothetical protein